MKKHIIYLILIIGVLTSCQEVIDLKLDTTESQLVIQGNIYDTPRPYYIKLSQTVDFDVPSNYPPVTGATVIISDNNGVTDTLTETEAGIYESSKIIGTIGYTYNLAVITDEITYTSTSTMPATVPIDSVYYEDAIFGDEKQLTFSFHDPKGIENYYRVIRFVNNVQQDGFSTITDNLNDGENTTYTYMSMSDDDVNTGDTVTFRLVSIDGGVYEYFRTAGGDMSQSASPSNPISNIEGGALGYFNACSYSTSSVIAK